MCLEELYKKDTTLPIKINCGHSYHIDCLANYENDTCPKCGVSFDHAEIKYLLKRYNELLYEDKWNNEIKENAQWHYKVKNRNPMDEEAEFIALMCCKTCAFISMIIFAIRFGYIIIKHVFDD